MILPPDQLVRLLRGGIWAAPNDTAYKRWSSNSGHKLLCKLCRYGPDLPFLGLAGHSDPQPPQPSRPWFMPYPFLTYTSHGIGKAQTQSSHLLTRSPPMPPRAKHIHISHTPPTHHITRTTLIQCTSAALDTIRVPPTCHARTTPHPSPTPALP